MKKYLSMLAVVAVAASALAQGTVNFANNSSTLVKLQDGTSVPKDGGFVQLLWAPSGTAATAWNPTQTLTQWLAANQNWNAVPDVKAMLSPGRFIGGTLSLPTAAPGAPVQAAVAGWSGNYTSFDLAQASGVAQIAITPSFALNTGNPTTTPPGTPNPLTTATGFTGVNLVVVPEPSTLALAGLGAAALLIFRRRK
jgi:hypothetical protein